MLVLAPSLGHGIGNKGRSLPLRSTLTAFGPYQGVFGVAPVLKPTRGVSKVSAGIPTIKTVIPCEPELAEEPSTPAAPETAPAQSPTLASVEKMAQASESKVMTVVERGSRFGRKVFDGQGKRRSFDIPAVDARPQANSPKQAVLLSASKPFEHYIALATEYEAKRAADADPAALKGYALMKAAVEFSYASHGNASWEREVYSNVIRQANNKHFERVGDLRLKSSLFIRAREAQKNSIYARRFFLFFRKTRARNILRDYLREIVANFSPQVSAAIAKPELSQPAWKELDEITKNIGTVWP